MNVPINLFVSLPEPGALLLVGFGLIVVGLALRKVLPSRPEQHLDPAQVSTTFPDRKRTQDAATQFKAA